MLEFQEDLYATLGVTEQASPDEVRKAYLKLAKKLHPDRFPNDPEKRSEAQAEFSRVTRAHDVLSDSKQKEEYDALRQLAKNKAALDSGEGGASALASDGSGAGGSKTEVRETKDTWAAKHHERAMDLLKRGKYPEAETAIKEAIRLCPNNSSFHTCLAEICLGRGWKTLAQTSVQTALKLDPQNMAAKQVELKIKTLAKSQSTKKAEKGGKGLLDQLKELLGKK